MLEALHKFPTTPHLAWLGTQPLRRDKLLPRQEVDDFLKAKIVIEEKIDGANLGISFGDSDQLLLHNRSQWLEGKLTGQWERLRGWAADHTPLLREHLPNRCVLFGEWCAAQHSIYYERLPDWFLGFDIFDGRTKRFWSTERRDALLLAAGVARVPAIGRGEFSLPALRELAAGRSAFGESQREGLYLRREDRDWLTARAKLVNPEFTQAIGEHWSRQRMRLNRVEAQSARQGMAALP